MRCTIVVLAGLHAAALGACAPQPAAAPEAGIPDAAPAPAPASTRSLRVRLTDPDGGPPAASYANVWWGEGTDAEFGTPLQYRPGEDGFMVLEDLPRAPVTLCALPDGFVVPTAGMPRTLVGPDETEATLVLDVGTSRTLRVVGTSPRGHALAYLAAVEDLEPSHHGVDDDGSLRLEGLRPGVTYNLFVREFETHRCALLRDLPFDSVWPVIELGQGRDVTGTVLAPEGCDPPTVALLVGKAVMIDGGSAGEDGTFTIRGVPDGTYTAVAYTTHGERYLAGNARVEAGGSVTIDLRPRSE